MGFMIFGAVALAFSVASLISIALLAIGAFLYIRRRSCSSRTRRVFWSVLAGIILTGIVCLNLVRFPQGAAGSNYSEWLNEWLIKAVVYALLPGVACLVGGVVSNLAKSEPADPAL